jgi:hypothetical protein
MKRREFMTLAGGAAALTLIAPPALHAQPSARTRRIGFLMGYAEGDRRVQAGVDGFREGLGVLG